MASDSVLSQLQQSASSQFSTNQASTTPTKKKSAKELGTNEFLNLLVTQLKNQDPTNPMNSDDFAVNLAQFSQLEQLISIKDAVNATKAAPDASSLAGYLGHTAVFNSSAITAGGAEPPSVMVDMGADATDVKLSLKDSAGNVSEEIEIGALGKGKHIIPLTGMKATSGTYTVEATAVNSSGGGSSSPGVYASGRVTGFVPGADPKLLVGDSQYSPTEIKEVREE